MQFGDALVLRVPGRVEGPLEQAQAAAGTGSRQPRLEVFSHKLPTLAGFLALRTASAGQFIEDRREPLATSEHHGCDRYYDITRAVDRDGVLLGLGVDVVDDGGVFPQFGVGTHDNALSAAIDDVLADFGNARVTEFPIRPWWIVDMIDNGR